MAMISIYDEKPWRSLHPECPSIQSLSPTGSMLDVFRLSVARRPNNIALRYFDSLISYQSLDALSDSFAVWLTNRGARRHDRVCIVLQNVPQFVIAVLGAWKIGAIPTPVNPMYKEGELRKIFADCSPAAVVCYRDNSTIIRAALDGVGIAAAVLTDLPRDCQKRDDFRVLPEGSAQGEAGSFLKVLAAVGSLKPAPVALTHEDIGLLMYTSGTTGVPKGVMLTHENLVFNAQVSSHWFEFTEHSRILGIAPLFHITGFEVHMCLAFASQASLVLTYRFQPQVVLDAMLEHRPTFSIGAITAFIALMNAQEASESHFATFDRIYSGGAPIPPAVVDEFKAKFKVHIHTSYGMTELTAPSHYAPLNSNAPSLASGAGAIGIPIFQTEARIVDEAGCPVAVGESGELLVRGPQVMAGYWNKPVETAEALRDGWMHTGDIGFMDALGWFYLNDRKKDMIIASGFKVWPREVEDILYTHPAIREAAVVGIPDPYRGESVKACVSLKTLASATTEELILFCRERLASYKVPRVIEIQSDLPKNTNGKILRNQLRLKS